MEEEVNLIDLWRVIWKYRVIITVVVLVGVIATGVISFLLPRQYKATASLLPQIEMSKVAIAVPSEFAGLVKSQNPVTDVIVALLRSETMRADIIKKFGLKEFYRAEYYETALKQLERATEIKVSRENVISVSVISTQPQLAADIANFYVSNLDNLNERLKITAAKPMVTQLDMARVPEKKYKPNVKLNIVLSGMFSFFLAVFLAFFLEYCQKVKTQKVRESR